MIPGAGTPGGGWGRNPNFEAHNAVVIDIVDIVLVDIASALNLRINLPD